MQRRFDGVSMLRSERAVAAAVAVAAHHDILVGQPRVLWDSNNTVVHLHPAPVVAKVAANERRPDGAGALAYELAVGAHLARIGAPVAEPSREVPSEVHWHDGLAMTFWRHYEHNPDARVPCVAIAATLREVHRALASFPGRLPDFRARVTDARTVFQQGHSRRLRERDRDFLVAERDRLRAALDELNPRIQPLHGSPHGFNRLTVAGGVVWIDFETACRGPLEADLGFAGCREAFPEADPRLLALFADVASVNTAIACWARMDEAPDLAWHAAHHLGVLRSRRLRRRRA
jgi:Phosphotransferase enzyme family